MNRLIVLIATLFYSISSYTQDAQLVILSTKGEVTYSPPSGGESIDLLPGLTIPNVGNIYVKSDSKVRLIIKQKSVLLTGPGRYEVADIYKSNTEKSMSFSARFWNFVTSGMSNTDDKKDLIKYHREYMKMHGGVKGYSEEEGSITLLSPKGGRIMSAEVIFSWDMIHDMAESSYTFQMMDSDRKLVMQRNVTGNQITVNLHKLSNGEEGSFTWKVIVNKGEKSKSTESAFSFNPHTEDDINEKLLYINDYIEADESEKQWMKAIVLEMEGFYYDAEKLYQTLIEKDTDNLFLIKNYALFLSRQDRLEAAKNLIN